MLLDQYGSQLTRVRVYGFLRPARTEYVRVDPVAGGNESNVEAIGLWVDQPEDDEGEND